MKDINAVPLGSQYDATDSNNREGLGSNFNVGMAQINANDTMTADDLFTDAACWNRDDEMQGSPLQAQLAAQFVSDLTLYVNHGVRTLDLNHLDDSGILGGTKVTMA